MDRLSGCAKRPFAKQSGILIVGQTPPPYGGQAVMIERLLRCRLHPWIVDHVRMAFSHQMDEVSKFRLKKVYRVLHVISAIWRARIRSGHEVLYYPPAGPNLVPVLRDTVILLAVRWMFRKTVFHFHAGGVMSFVESLSPLLRRMARRAYRQPDLTIRTAVGAPEDGLLCGSRRDMVIANAVEDLSAAARGWSRSDHRLNVLYLGVLREDKGVLVLLEAGGLLRARGYDFRITLAGACESKGLGQRIAALVEHHDLVGRVSLPGVVVGVDKARAFADADIFCFPTFFASETFGLVTVEAMSFRLPVVATVWRGLPDVIQDGVEGYLVPIKDPRALAARLEMLMLNASLRQRMGEAGRRTFERRFTLDRFCVQMRDAFASLIDWQDQEDSGTGGRSPPNQANAPGSVSPTPRGER